MIPTMTEREGMRERIAQIIEPDPCVWEGFQSEEQYRKFAFERADQVLALLSPLIREAMEALEPFKGEADRRAWLDDPVNLGGYIGGSVLTNGNLSRARTVHAKLKAMMEGK